MPIKLPPCPTRAQILLSPMHLCLHVAPAASNCSVLCAHLLGFSIVCLKLLKSPARLWRSSCSQFPLRSAGCSQYFRLPLSHLMYLMLRLLRRKAKQVQDVHSGWLMCPNMTWATFRDPGQKFLLSHILLWTKMAGAPTTSQHPIPLLGQVHITRIAAQCESPMLWDLPAHH